MNKPLAGLHVLVVEDEMLILMMIEDMLAELGCESVTAAASVDQAIALIDAQTFDIAMLDANLDGGTSDPVGDALAARGVPFFFATGYKDHGASGAHRERHVLKKPFQLKDLRESFMQVLSLAGRGVQSG